MNKHLWLALLVVAPNVVRAEELITQSRANYVRILFDTNTPTGSGFLLDQQHAATCFHVVASGFAQIVSNRVTNLQWTAKVDASINRGNSGGALVNTNGTILGIISMREGSLSKELSATRDVIRKMGKRMGRIEFGTDIGNVSSLDLTLKTIDTVDTFISTGIGYATNIRFLDAYLCEHQLTRSSGVFLRSFHAQLIDAQQHSPSWHNI